MPGRDGTGPFGSGNYGGRMGGPLNAGPVGYCQCPNCGTKVKHNRGLPCSNMECPNCKTTMIRV